MYLRCVVIELWILLYVLLLIIKYVYKLITGSAFRGDKWPTNEAYDLPSRSSKVENKWSYTSSPPQALMVCIETGLPFTCRDNPENKNNNLKLHLLFNSFYKISERSPSPALISPSLPITFEKCIENTTEFESTENVL